MQPHFLPFAGYFELLLRTDILVYYDTAQFCRRSWHSRTWIRQGLSAALLTVPVRRIESCARPPLSAMYLDDDQPWRQCVLRRLLSVYGCLPEDLVTLFQEGPERLVDFNMLLVGWLAGRLGITTPTILASALVPPAELPASERLVWICRRLEATRYLATPGARDYMDVCCFEDAGIEVAWLSYEYRHRLNRPNGGTVYPSLLDLLLVDGAIRARSEFELTPNTHLMEG